MAAYEQLHRRKRSQPSSSDEEPDGGNAVQRYRDAQWSSFETLSAEDIEKTHILRQNAASGPTLRLFGWPMRKIKTVKGTLAVLLILLLGFLNLAQWFQRPRPLPSESVGKAIVLASFRKQDVKWAEQVPPE